MAKVNIGRTKLRRRSGKPNGDQAWLWVLRVTGLGLLVREAVLRGERWGERPYLLAFYAGMMGLPFFFGREKEDGEDDNEPPRALPAGPDREAS